MLALCAHKPSATLRHHAHATHLHLLGGHLRPDLAGSSWYSMAWALAGACGCDPGRDEHARDRVPHKDRLRPAYRPPCRLGTVGKSGLRHFECCNLRLPLFVDVTKRHAAARMRSHTCCQALSTLWLGLVCAAHPARGFVSMQPRTACTAHAAPRSTPPCHTLSGSWRAAVRSVTISGPV